MSPKVDPADRRAEILDATIRCFIRTGYNGTSMDDVVRETGLSKGTLYWHFANKEELFLAAFDRMVLDMVAMPEDAIDESLPPAEQLRQVFAMSFGVLTEADMLDALPVNFLMELWQQEGFMARYQTAMTPYAEMLMAIIEAGIASGDFRQVDVYNTVWGFMAALDGVILYLMAGIPDKTAATGLALSEVLIAGLLK